MITQQIGLEGEKNEFLYVRTYKFVLKEYHEKFRPMRGIRTFVVLKINNDFVPILAYPDKKGIFVAISTFCGN